ncbi:MAG: cell division protein FtsW, partial [Solirubrobacteraceae bacterium]|nr:cell division protein FtsW [Solirubrobacteraceae bacterium]
MIRRRLRAASGKGKARGSRSAGQANGSRSAAKANGSRAGRSGSAANGRSGRAERSSERAGRPDARSAPRAGRDSQGPPRSGSPPAGDGTGETRKRSTPRRPPPLEHRILVTATLCLLAFGAVMVYSASAGLSVLASHGGGSGTSEFVRYLAFGTLGLAAMQFLSKRGLSFLNSRMLTLMVLGSMALLLMVLLPGVGRMVNGARRWFAAGPIQFQPSELMKLSLVLYVARYLADNPKRLRGLRETIGPIALVAAPAILLIVAEPDLGTALVVAFTLTAMLVAAGMPMRHLAIVGGLAFLAVIALVLAEPYQQARLTSFLHPWAAAAKNGYQSVQGQIALGSGGLLGVGLGRSVQKLFYLPEAQTDFILAVIGEELGVLGIAG